ncbi:hypothetical protein [Halopiger goleimassiliensis]|uniref:hypothetical protein n=1 Tax=Halopiger goleimassiliensis TaxID=1293048 RepID=UPI0012B5E979|nr:hypothetical protein [Halopiger goleimassiliensis]
MGSLDADDSDDTGGGDTQFEDVAVLGTAEPYSIAATPEREYEYLEDDEAVRIEYDDSSERTMSFDEWGRRRATAAAADEMRSLLSDEGLADAGASMGVIERDDIDESRTSRDPDPSLFDREVDIGVTVAIDYQYGGEELVREPETDFDTLVESIPPYIEVTMLFEERNYTADVPILCWKHYADRTELDDV